MATLPSLQTTADKYQAAVERGSAKKIPGLAEVMAAHETAMEALDRKPLIDAEKQRLRGEAEAAVRVKAAELKEAARAAALQAYDQAEGQLRAAARADGTQASDAEVRAQVFRHQRAQQLASRADRAGTVKAVLEVYGEAQLTEDETTIHTVGAAVQQKLDLLGQGEKGKDQTPVRNAAEQFRQEFQGWQKEHPSVTQRLDQIQRGRAQMEVLFEESANFALQLFGIRRNPQAPKLRSLPEGEPRRGLVNGSHWDRIQGRK